MKTKLYRNNHLDVLPLDPTEDAYSLKLLGVQCIIPNNEGFIMHYRMYYALGNMFISDRYTKSELLFIARNYGYIK